MTYRRFPNTDLARMCALKTALNTNIRKLKTRINNTKL